MYARLIKLNLGPGARKTAEGIADAAARIFRASRGFKSVTFFMDDKAGEYCGFSVWESMDALEAAVAAVQPVLKEKAGDLLKTPPQAGHYEVYEAKT